MGEGVSTIRKGVKKTDRSYLHDTDSGMNRQEAFRVNQLESKIRNRKTEKGYIVGADGNVIGESIRSTRSSAAFRVNDLVKSKDAIMTHNHPNADMGGTMAARVGLPFSGTDLERAITYDQKEIRAVTPNYTYSIRRPKGGWGDKSTIMKAIREWDRDRLENYYSYKNSSARRNSSINETADRGNVGGQWAAWKKFMKKTGITVTRRKS